MIPQTAIEDALDALDDEGAVEEAILEFAQVQTPYLQYLQTEGFELLSGDERDYLQYLALVIYAAVVDEEEHVRTLRGEQIETWDERCWEWMQEGSNRSMSQRFDTFFERIDEEELLAFVEDSLVDPEPDDVEGADAPLFDSAENRELGFVALATLVGGLHEQIVA